jgi:hypothetical protein
MAEDFLSKFIGSPNRAKILCLFIFNQKELFTLAHIVKRAGLSVQVVSKEVKTLEQLGIIKKGKFTITLGNGANRTIKGKHQKEQTWLLAPNFKYVNPLSKFIHEISPVRYDNIMIALRRTGKLAAVILSGTFVGDATRPADLIVAGDALNESRLEQAVKALEPGYGREIRYAAFSTPEFRYRLTIQDRLIRDTLDYPHLVLLDRTRLL